MQGRNAIHGHATVVRFVFWRFVLVGLSTVLILGLYPAILRAIAPGGS